VLRLPFVLKGKSRAKWEEKVALVKEWLQGERNCDMVWKMIQQGNEDPSSREVCWMHILVELHALMSKREKRKEPGKVKLATLSLFERQILISKKREEKLTRLRAEQDEREARECTHQPNFFTRKDSFPEIQSVVKFDPSATWSVSPINRRRQLEKVGTLSASPKRKSRALLQKSFSKELEEAAGKSKLLEECRGALEVSKGNQFDDQKHNFPFAQSFNNERCKIQLRNRDEFLPDSFFRRSHNKSVRSGVSLEMGFSELDMTEKVVAVLFDRCKFTEPEALKWMNENNKRLLKL